MHLFYFYNLHTHNLITFAGFTLAIQMCLSSAHLQITHYQGWRGVVARLLASITKVTELARAVLGGKVHEGQGW